MQRQNFFFAWLLVIGVILFPDSPSAQNIVLKTEYAKRIGQFGLELRVPRLQPVVGLALSGGGARGLSQIGVLKALVEKHVPVSLICGTSMGSIVGGLYSLGYTPPEIDSICKATDWEDILSSTNRTNRRDLFFDKKLTEDKSVFALRLRGLKPLIPTAINDGQKFTNYLNILSFQAPIRLQENFDELETKFRAVCTDLVSGSAVVLRSGSIAKALRASSSVSFLLSPVSLDSMLLVDGGLTANIPVKITKDEGADFVIAVNTTSLLHNKQELELPWNVADQIISIPMQLMNTDQLKLADFVINPSPGNFLSSEFQYIDSAIAEGYKSTVPVCDSLNSAIKKLFIKRLSSNDTLFTNVFIHEAPAGILNKCKAFFNGSSLYKSEILYFLYSLNTDDDFVELSAIPGKYGDTTYIDITAKPFPAIIYSKISGSLLTENPNVNSSLSELNGHPFSSKRVMKVAKDILNGYRLLGNSLAEIDSIYFNASSRVLTFYVNPGIISNIEIRGLTSTNPNVIRREISLERGDVFLSSNFKQGLTNLRSLNIFDNIVVSFERQKEGNAVFFEIEERTSGIVRFGFKLDNENLPQVGIDIRDENLFGNGSEVGFMTLFSTQARSYILEQRGNRLFDSFYSYDVRAFFNFNDIYTYSENLRPNKSNEYSIDLKGEYRQIFYGFSVAAARQFQRLGNVSLRGTYQMDEVQNIRDGSLREGNYKNRFVTIRASSNIDTQDKYPYPTSGAKINVFYEFASTVLGSNFGFTNIGGEYHIHIPVGLRHTISTSAKVGFGDKTLPLTQHYSLGGQNSFFGMKENELRGRQIVLASLEYRYLLPVQVFFDTYFQVRYDLGSVWENQNQIRFADLRHGIGASLSFKTPIGPADFAIGRSFYFQTNEPTSPVKMGPLNFYFSIGFYY